MANDQKKEIKINFPPELLGGVYANNMHLNHNKHEFVMDYLFVAPNGGKVNARVIVSPAHMKSILKVIQNNIKKYEQQYGVIETIEAPKIEPKDFN